MSRLSAMMGHVLLCVDARLSAKVNAAGCVRDVNVAVMCRSHVF